MKNRVYNRVSATIACSVALNEERKRLKGESHNQIHHVFRESIKLPTAIPQTLNPFKYVIVYNLLISSI